MQKRLMEESTALAAVSPEGKSRKDKKMVFDIAWILKTQNK